MALIYFVVCFTLSQIVRAYQRRLKGARTGKRNLLTSTSG